MAVQLGLEHSTESPVWTSLGSTRVLNFTASTLVSALRVTRPPRRLERLGSVCVGEWVDGGRGQAVEPKGHPRTSVPLDPCSLLLPQSSLSESVLDDPFRGAWWGRGARWMRERAQTMPHYYTMVCKC